MRKSRSRGGFPPNWQWLAAGVCYLTEKNVRQLVHSLIVLILRRLYVAPSEAIIVAACLGQRPAWDKKTSKTRKITGLYLIASYYRS